MTAAAPPFQSEPLAIRPTRRRRAIFGAVGHNPRFVIGSALLASIVALCLVTMLFTLRPSSSLYYDAQFRDLPASSAPEAGHVAMWFGTDNFGRSMLGRCLLGGVVSVSVGVAAAAISVVLGVTVGLFAGYRGGWIDATLMRSVDILYGLPYILLIILFKIAFEDRLALLLGGTAANLVVLFAAIGLVSWLTMARVIRGQVLSLRGQPFVEACRAIGLSRRHASSLKHILPNLDRTDHGLCDPDHSAGDPPGKLPQLPGRRRRIQRCPPGARWPARIASRGAQPGSDYSRSGGCSSFPCV